MMKNTEIIKVAALVALTVALLYRKYAIRKKSGKSASGKKPDKPIFSSGSQEDDYEPYSKKAVSE
jgi:hypothetical protein